MEEALKNLIRVTRDYIAPGIPEVDEAIRKAQSALDAEVVTKALRHYEGMNPQGPRYL